MTAYYTATPNPGDPAQQVLFGTSGHRGSALAGAFNEAHIQAIIQAVVEYRTARGATGPLYIGRDTHGLSEPAWTTALEVLAANDVTVFGDAAGRYTPTPAVSHAILTYNRGRSRDLAGGIVVTPSRNPPASGGFKYNPPHGGPADTAAITAITKRANEILCGGCAEVKRIPLGRALRFVRRHDYLGGYVDDLPTAIDHLFIDRLFWPARAGVGKTAVSSSIIDRVATGVGRRLFEVQVGFKWFVGGLLEGSIGFGGEESAGASFLRCDGTVDHRQRRHPPGAAGRRDAGRHR